ncbi:MAG: hypothetical protein WAQ28_14770 [Bacteroidia bacterium]
MTKQLLFIFPFFIFSFIPCFSVAQDTIAVNNTNKNYKWGGGVQLSTPYEFTAQYLEASNGFYPGFIKDYSAYSFGFQLNHIGNYYIQRLKVGICNRIQANQGDSSTTNGVGDVFNETIKQRMLYSSLGIGRIVKYKYAHLYGGLELSFIHYGQYAHNLDYSVYESGSLAYGGVHVTSPGGFATGMGAFSGCDFFLFKQISIGVELALSFLYSKTGGVQPMHSWYNGSNAYDQVLTTTNFKEHLYISNLKPSINLSYYF